MRSPSRLPIGRIRSPRSVRSAFPTCGLSPFSFIDWLARADGAPWPVAREGSGDGEVGHPGLARRGVAKRARPEIAIPSQEGEHYDATREALESVAAGRFRSTRPATRPPAATRRRRSRRCAEPDFPCRMGSSCRSTRRSLLRALHVRSNVSARARRLCVRPGSPRTWTTTITV